MHDVETRRAAGLLLELGLTRRDVCRILGVGYTSTYRWQRVPGSTAQPDLRCFRCLDEGPVDRRQYVYLLGQYLGDGHIARVGRSWGLSIACCTHYPGILAEVEAAMRATIGASLCRQSKPGAAVVVRSTTRHWLCLFPQHGAGRKHERAIRLEPWQRELVAADPRPLVRGLIHSDGCRILNTVRRPVGGRVRTYAYPRYLFSNLSTDIQAIFTDALGDLGIAWRRNRYNPISVARRTAVAALDEFVGPKQ